MRFISSLFVVAALTCARSARADTFTLTGPGVYDTFTLPSSPTVSKSGAYGFTIIGVSVNENGTEVTDNILFFTKSDGGGLLLESPSGTGINPFGEVLYTGTVYSPTFKTGTFTLASLTDSYHLSVSGTTATPEPDSVLLLSTGLIAAGFAAYSSKARRPTA